MILGASSLVAEPTPRFAVYGTRGSFIKYGLDPQEAWLKAGETPEVGWGEDDNPGRLTLDEGRAMRSRWSVMSCPARQATIELL